MKKWFTGILATIIAGVTVYWLTVGIDGAKSLPKNSETTTQSVPRQQVEAASSSNELVTNDPSKPIITITTPISESVVDVYKEITGTVSNTEAEVWVIIHPLETPTCWVQMPVVVNVDGTWSTTAQFGEEDPAHKGKPYEVRAFVNPQSNLSPGSYRCWPNAAASTNSLYVQRK